MVGALAAAHLELSEAGRQAGRKWLTLSACFLTGDRRLMAKPNYAFAKRQRDLAKKKKKEDKQARKSGPDENTPEQQSEAVDGTSSTA
jgi:hypothetical protein